MKLKFFFTYCLFSLAIQSNGQDVFTDAFTGKAPYAIHIVGNDMYVTTYLTNKLYKLNLDDSSNIETVSSFNSGLWKIAFDSNNNDFYCAELAGQLSVVDLDLSFPITPNVIRTNSYIEGIEINDNIVYFADRDNLYTLSIDTGDFSLIYNEPDGKIRNPRIYNNELYYQVFDTNSRAIYKIDISLTNPTKILVSLTGHNGALHSSLVVKNYLYLGFAQPNELARIDLSDSNLPLTPTVLFENVKGGVIGLANKDENIYFSSGGVQTLIYKFNDSVLSVSELNSYEEMIYPNPTKDYIIHQGNTLYQLYEIYSISGKLIKSGNFDKSINVQKLKSGIYFIKYVSDGKQSVHKFMKN